MPGDRFELALEHLHAGRAAQARAMLTPLAARHPDDFAVVSALAECVIACQDWTAAEYQVERLTRRHGALADTWTLVLKLHMARGQHEPAAEAARRAIDRDPANPERHRHLCVVHAASGDFVAQSRAAKAGLALAPDDDDLCHKHAVALLNLGRSSEAAGAFREATARCPGSLSLREGLATCLNYADGVGADELAAAHREFGALLAASVGATDLPRPPRVRRDPSAPLRVGLLSADLRRHSVAFFVQPLLQHAHPGAIEWWCYSTAPREDDLSTQLRGMVGPARWKHLPGLVPATLAAAIRADGLDLLIDLGGLTVGHNLAALALRPAPRLATYCGYPNTTGLACVDARIVDTLTDPPGFGDEGCSERLWRLPRCFLAYAPPASAPPIADQRQERPLTFGSCNVLRKVSDATLRLWAAALAVDPRSRLLIKAAGLQHTLVAADLRARLQRAGIAADRATLLGPVAVQADHLLTYAHIDIALDTFPYHGTTTTCEALWMGVPLISLAGSTHAARVGRSVLSAAGCPGWVTGSEVEWSATVRSVAADVESRGRWRRGARQALAGSELFDGAGLSAAFTSACQAIVRENRC